MTVSTSLSKLLQIIETLRKGGEQMPIQTAHVLLLIAARPGITMSELATMANLSQASTSRNVTSLGEWHRLGKPGYNLVETGEDPAERRRKILFLNAQGRALMQQLINTVEPETVIEEHHLPNAKEFITGVYRQKMQNANKR